MATSNFVDEGVFFWAYEQGWTNRGMAKALGVPHWWVSDQLKRLGLVTNRARGVPPKDLGEGLYECVKCLMPTPLADFPWVISKKDGRQLSYCRKCRAAQSRENMGASPESYWKYKTAGYRHNNRGINCDLSDNYLLSLWYGQNGKCFYTDEVLSLSLGKGRKRIEPSVDRVDQSKGYVEGNVVICSTRANTIKSDMSLDELQEWMPSWYARVVKMWRSIGLKCLQVQNGDF